MGDFIQLIIIGLVIYWVIKLVKNKTSKRNNRMDLDDFIAAEKMKMMNTLYAKDFFREERNLKRRGFNSKGIYIFTNIRNNKKYVGQSVRVLGRIRTHLKGRGNGDLHRDMMSGDNFTIELIRLKDTRYYDLNTLERHYITKHNSYVAGYNKTRGNR